MDFVLLIFRLILFAVFASAAAGKFLDLNGTRAAMREFGLAGAAGAAAIIIPAAEILIAIGLLFPATSWISACAGLFLLAGFTLGIARQMQRGSTADCHCFGQIHSEPPGPRSLIRNAIFAIPAVTLVISGRASQGPDLGSDLATTIYGVAIAMLFVGLLVAAAYLRLANEKISALAKRVEFLESISGGGPAVERDESGNPTDSLPIGAEFPDFQLEDLRGRIVTFEHLLTDFRPKLFFFVSPQCEPCKELIPEFTEWKALLGETIRFVFVSSGTADANKSRFGEEIAAQMLIQKDRELANLLYAKWTPTAVFVNREGKIASHPAVGDVAIRDLIDRLKEPDALDPEFYFANGNRPGRVKIGQAVPDFALASLDGRVINADFFRGRKTLVLFLSTTCSHCLTVIDQLRRLEKSFSNNELGIVIFSDGDPETVRDFDVQSPIVLDKGYSTATRIGMFGAPSAVLVNEDGIVVTETAIGGPAIWSLIGRYDVK
jgi:thiol-disulfide isomerase/thioredoxin